MSGVLVIRVVKVWPRSWDRLLGSAGLRVLCNLPRYLALTLEHLTLDPSRPARDGPNMVKYALVYGMVCIWNVIQLCSICSDDQGIHKIIFQYSVVMGNMSTTLITNPSIIMLGSSLCTSFNPVDWRKMSIGSVLAFSRVLWIIHFAVYS